jgi:hypothetical protein
VPRVEALEGRRLLAPLPVSVQATQLTAVAGRGVYAGTATLMATLTAAGAPLAGEMVTFTLEGGGAPIAVGSAPTDTTGLATLPGVALGGLNAGVFAGAVAASFAGDANDAASKASGDLTVSPAPATLSLGGLTTTYDGAPQVVSVATTPVGLTGVSVSYIANLLPVADPMTAGSYAVTATLNNPNYAAPPATGTLLINPAAPPVTWTNPAGIVYGTPLGPAQLDATSPIAGTFAYTQAAGIVLSAGAGQTLSGTFVPSDTVDYTAVTTTVTINVRPAQPSITWADPADIVYGTPLGADQLDATAAVAGRFTYTPAAGAILGAGMGQTLSAMFTPIDANDYATVTSTATINVLPATPIVTWPAPPATVYGTPLGLAQLDATASTPGVFTYTPAAGTVLSAGAGQTLSVSFTPADTADYAGGATASVLLNVVQAPLTVTVNDASKVYGQDNPDFGVSFSGFVNGDGPGDLNGALSFDTTAATDSDVGAYDVTARGLSSSNYSIRQVKGTLTITPADQTITWSNPADIVYGTSLDDTQLDASVSAGGPAPPGALSYTPAAGTVLNAGEGQVLTVVAAATNDYNPATATVTLNVAKATPVITWSNPADIVYGIPLGPAQLNASVSSPDASALVLTYSPPAGTLLSAGSDQTLTVSTAATANDNAATATATLNVVPATPGVTWADPADIVYGTPLGPAQLDAAASLPGTFTYTPAAGTVLDAGPVQTLTATFTPADATDYQAITVNTLVNVTRASLVATASDAATAYGAAVPVLGGTVSGLVNNDPVGVTFATPAAIGSPVGTYAIMPVLVDPNDRMSNYQIVLDYGKLTIAPAPLTVTTNSASIAQGQPLPAFTVSYAGFVAGDGPGAVKGTPSFSLPPAAAGQAGVYPVMPAGLSAANYAIRYADGFLIVTPPPAPLVTVQSVHWQTLRIGHRKPVRALVVSFSAALDPGAAQNLNAYHLMAVSLNGKVAPRSTRAISLASITYDPSAHTVTLTPRGQLPNQPLQLSINAALVLDSHGRPIDGTYDGQPGGTFVTLVKGS